MTDTHRHNRKKTFTTSNFRTRHFPGIDDTSWHSWKWQLQHRIDTFEKLQHFLEPSAEERAAFTGRAQRIPFSITPHFMELLSSLDTDSPLRKTVIPLPEEFQTDSSESSDPLAEEDHSPTPAIVHRYPDRVLFLATLQCAVYCRYCTRARIFSQQPVAVNRTRHWQEGLAYIAQNKCIREVIVSGGDPLILGDSLLSELLGNLREISHVRIIRLGSKLPIVLPQRITPELVSMLRTYHPIILSLHTIHPDELTKDAAEAITRLADAGIVIGSQTVLLKGVNDDPVVIQNLMESLLALRVRPYALFHCDPIIGSGHFRTRLEKGLEILEHMRRHSSGYAIPQYIIDPPGGKVSLAPTTLIAKRGPEYRLKNWRGDEIEYVEPQT